MHPFMGLTSWAAFTPHSQSELMVMGDLVLFEDEVNPVMSVALDNGLEVTALHNHFYFDTPRVMFMHRRQRHCRKARHGGWQTMDKVKEVRKANPNRPWVPRTAIPETNAITASIIDTILNVRVR
jgi:hypothetical protein